MSEPLPGALSRRSFLTTAGQGIAAASLVANLAAPAGAQTNPPPDPNTRPIPLPPTEARTEQQSGPEDLPLPPDRRVGFAVVGLDNLAIQHIIPAFGECKNAKLTALVSGDPAKAGEVARQHGIPPPAPGLPEHVQALAGHGQRAPRVARLARALPDTGQARTCKTRRLRIHINSAKRSVFGTSRLYRGTYHYHF